MTLPAIFLTLKLFCDFPIQEGANTNAKSNYDFCDLFFGFLSQTPGAQEPAKPKVVTEQPSQPSCRYCPNPEFPAEARKAKISDAKVLIEVTVTEKGDVDPQEMRVIEDPGHGFAEEALTVVKKWKFNPATLKNGEPTKIRTKVQVQFTRQ